jgi:hypothetical protein
MSSHPIPRREGPMPSEDQAGRDEAPQFRSPKRTLARAFRLSRDRWKEKATQRREELRSLKVRLRDVEASRELWKQKAAHLQEQLARLSAAACPALSEQDASSEQTAEARPPQAGAAPASAAPPPGPAPGEKKRRR